MKISEIISESVQGVAEGKQPGKPVVDAIQKVLPIAQEIWFHGSRATGKHRRNSDTDILVIVPDDLVGDRYLGVVRILQKLSSTFDNYDIQPTKAGTNIHRIAQEEGRLLWSNKQGVTEDSLPEHIVKVPGGYELRSKHGNKNLGKYPTRAGAEKRERQVQYFKHAK
jgi:predicted nucleotidyltransferase